MPTFVFQAKTIQGKVVKGTIDAENDVEVRVRLRTKHLIPTQIKIKKTTDATDIFSSLSLDFLKNKGIPSKELQSTTRQFSTLINAGIPILQSVSILSQSTKNKNLKETLNNVSHRIQSGSDLSDALEAHPHIFDSSYINMVRAGEAGGLLDSSLNRIAEYIERVEKLKGQVKSVLWYPIAVIIISIIVVTVIVVYVIPKFEELFTSSGMDIPAMTQFVIDMSHFIKNFWYLIIIGAIGFVVGIILFYRSEAGRKIMDSLFIGLPVIGPLIQKNALARTCRTFSSMLSSGVFILDSLDIAAKTAGNILIMNAFKDAKQAVIDGESLAVPFSKNKYIPNMVVQMIGIGEQTGNLDELLNKVSNFYEDEVEQGMSAMLSLLEPVLIVCLGGVIGFIVITLYLPIFQLAEGI